MKMQEKLVLFMYEVITKKFWLVMKQIILLKKLFESSLNNYQKDEQNMRGESDFNFESVELLDYHLRKVSLKRGKSYIKSPN